MGWKRVSPPKFRHWLFFTLTSIYRVYYVQESENHYDQHPAFITVSAVFMLRSKMQRIKTISSSIWSPWWYSYVVKRTNHETLRFMRISPLSRHVLRLRSKYCSQHPVLPHPQSIFLLGSDNISKLYRKDKIIVFHIIIFLLKYHADGGSTGQWPIPLNKKQKKKKRMYRRNVERFQTRWNFS